MPRICAFFWAAALALTATAAARDIPPAPREFVLDEAQWLSSGEERALVQKLLRYERESSNQIVVALFRSLDGEDLADFSQRVAESWGVGQGEKDNGILLAVYAEDRLVDIEVGYGLEGVVTDLIAAQIIENEIRPAFRAQRYVAGISAAVDALIAASRGEYEGTGRANADRDDDGSGFPFWLIFLLFILLGGRGGRSWWLAPMLFSSMGRRGGGFGGGGFGGGSFRGGGGSFGGGGARGGW